mmetsp:Transcript_25957/g.55231  ORF Transcript_25957/g.55231 Transcript_25957/m.55231 type:complete len:211 (+) Transcript_25957:1884-2516(+)
MFRTISRTWMSLSLFMISVHTCLSFWKPARASDACSSRDDMVLMTRTLSSIRFIGTSWRKKSSAVMSLSSSPLYFLMACISLGVGRRLGMNCTRSPTILRSGSTSLIVSASERKEKSLNALRLMAMLFALVRSSSLAMSLPASSLPPPPLPPAAPPPLALALLRFWKSSSSFLMSASSGLMDASFRFFSSSLLPKMLCSSSSGARLEAVQ